jgi:hypothetical protein
MKRKLAMLSVSIVTALMLSQSADAARRVRHHYVAGPAPERRIACTVIGCMPIPPECQPVAGKTPGGIPTGYDVIACPPGRSPW